MKLIWHIIKKDFTHDRWALLLWAGLFVAQVGLGLVLLRTGGGDKETVVKLQLVGAALILLQVLMGYILVARLVQVDAVIGTELFWVTRPISRVRLLVAKISGVLLIFGLLPVALLLPWWLYNNFGARDILWAAVETFGWQLLVIAPAFLVASLTDDLGRVLLWTLLLVMGLMIWFVLLQSVNLNIRLPAENATGIFVTRTWLVCLMMLSGATLIAVHQYLTRHFVRSAVLVLLGLGVLAMVSRGWQWDWSKQLAQITRPVPVAPAGLAEGLSLRAGRAWVAGKTSRGTEKVSSLRVQLHAQGLPADMSLIAEEVTQSWRWAGSPVFKRNSQFGMARFPAESFLRQELALPVPAEDPETTRWYQAARENEMNRLAKVQAKLVAQGLPSFIYPALFPTKHDGPVVLVNAVLPDSVIAKMRPEPPAYSARLEGVITRPEIAAELPLKLQARASGDSQTFRLVHLLPLKEKDYEATAATIVSTAPTSRRSGLWLVGEVRREVMGFFRWQGMDVNRTTGDVSRMNESRLSETWIAGVCIKWRQFSVHPFTLIRNGVRVLKDPEWREHTSLVMLAEKEVARFTQEVQADRFELETTDGRE